MTISINDIQKAIQACLVSEPPWDGVFLSRDGSLLADILGGITPATTRPRRP